MLGDYCLNEFIKFIYRLIYNGSIKFIREMAMINCLIMLRPADIKYKRNL